MSDTRRVIAIEEAFAMPEQFEAYRGLGPGVFADDRDVYKMTLLERSPFIGPVITDVGEGRLARMDAAGVDLALLSLAAPGVQSLGREEGVELSRVANDRLAEIVQTHPDRFGGLGCFAPQDPDRAAREIERCVKQLGFPGVLVNSHTHGRYLDEPDFEPILAAVCELDVPLYLHPRNPPATMMPPLMAAGPVFEDTVPWVQHEGGGPVIADALWGFNMETSMHVVRLIMSGTFERHPKLKLLLGHMGEGLVGMLYRLDWAAQTGFGLPRPPSEVFRQHVWVTTSSITDTPLSRQHLHYVHQTMGADRILFAADHPFGDMAEMVRALEGSGLPEASIDAIAHGNAQRLFGMSA